MHKISHLSFEIKDDGKFNKESVTKGIEPEVKGKMKKRKEWTGGRAGDTHAV